MLWVSGKACNGSRRDRINNCSVSRVARSIPDWILAKWCSCSSLSSLIANTSAWILSAANGLRNSWAASEVKRLSRCKVLSTRANSRFKACTKGKVSRGTFSETACKLWASRWLNSVASWFKGRKPCFTAYANKDNKMGKEMNVSSSCIHKALAKMEKRSRRLWATATVCPFSGL